MIPTMLAAYAAALDAAAYLDDAITHAILVARPDLEVDALYASRDQHRADAAAILLELALALRAGPIADELDAYRGLAPARQLALAEALDALEPRPAAPALEDRALGAWDPWGAAGLDAA